MVWFYVVFSSMHNASTKISRNAPGERLTCVVPVDVRRFIRIVGRRLRLVDEISDSFLTKSVGASQQSHVVEGRHGRSSETFAPKSRPSKTQTQLHNAFTLTKYALKESPPSLILKGKGYTVLH